MKQHLIDRKNLLSVLTAITRLQMMSNKRLKLALRSRKKSKLMFSKATTFPNPLLLPLTLAWSKKVSKKKPKRWYMRQATSRVKCHGLLPWKLILKVKFQIAKKVLKMIKILLNRIQQTLFWDLLASLDNLRFLQDPQVP